MEPAGREPSVDGGPLERAGVGAGLAAARDGAAPADESLFALEHVAFVADGKRILDRVDLVLEPGGLIAVTGPSGSGKSTLLRLLNGFEVPTEGVVRFRGRELSQLDPTAHRRRVGLVFQRPVVLGGSGADNLRVADPAASDADLEAALADVGLDACVLAQRADSLSGGEAQRLCVARTMLTRPEVLLMDEPTSALDEVSKGAIERLARRFVDRGGSVVWVSHEDRQLARIAERLVHLRDGRIVSS